MHAIIQDAGPDAVASQAVRRELFPRFVSGQLSLDQFLKDAQAQQRLVRLEND